MAEGDFDPAELALALNKAANRVGQLGRFHRNLAKPLKERLSRVRDLLPAVAMVPAITGSPVQLEDEVSAPPWE
ncbi:hypothetical protein D3C71_2094130 [compost metagenome]